jgi:hypothetical protein
LRKILIVAGNGALLLITAAFAPQPAATAQPRSVVAEQRGCRAAVERRLREWGAGDERYRDADAPSGVQQWRLPTRELGTWLLLQGPPDQPAAIARVDAGSTTRVAFDAQCNERLTMSEASSIGPAAGEAFTDSDLRSLLAAQPQGVIYLWSPHMPLSVDGYRTVLGVATRLRMSFTALRDPMSDSGYAVAVAKETGLPPDALRTFTSIELGFRQLSLHAPALLVFARGRVAGLAVPGYREAAGFESAIIERLRSISSVPDSYPVKEP